MKRSRTVLLDSSSLHDSSSARATDNFVRWSYVRSSANV